MKQHKQLVLSKIYVGILLVVFGGIVLHAPFSVAMGTLFPGHSLLIKSWKEILMLVAGVITIFLLYKTNKTKILRDPIILIIAAYAALHLALLIYNFHGVAASLAGLAIDLRYVFFFALVYIAINLYPEYRKIFIRVGIAGALIVLIFAILQVFILPHDILKYIGYNINTISPYLTVDQNNDFIRINSTLRGPNPLGAYSVIVLAIAVAAISKNKIKRTKTSIIITIALLFGGLVALWSSYSRSALIAAVLSVAIVLATTVFHKLSTKMWITIGLSMIILTAGVYMITGNQFMSNVLLHENPSGGSNISSNEGHINSLQDGINQLVRQPLGAGIGSTGSASLYSNNQEIIENQYLFTAHEIGWLGLVGFIVIFGLIIYRLWKLRSNWLSLGVFASGVGLALIGMLLPVWVDDTIAIIWWGLAAIVIYPKNRNIIDL
ncbi:MAG: O-antigen ligase family protein [Candidatus Saccharibacteria bacterium]